jgi:hypothetical protein
MEKQNTPHKDGTTKNISYLTSFIEKYKLQYVCNKIHFRISVLQKSINSIVMKLLLNDIQLFWKGLRRSNILNQVVQLDRTKMENT